MIASTSARVHERVEDAVVARPRVHRVAKRLRRRLEFTTLPRRADQTRVRVRVRGKVVSRVETKGSGRGGEVPGASARAEERGIHAGIRGKALGVAKREVHARRASGGARGEKFFVRGAAREGARYARGGWVVVVFVASADPSAVAGRRRVGTFAGGGSTSGICGREGVDDGVDAGLEVAAGERGVERARYGARGVVLGGGRSARSGRGSLDGVARPPATAAAGWPAAEAARPAAAPGVVEELGQIGKAAHAAGGGRSDGPPLLLPSLLGAGGAEAAWPHACPPLPFAWSGEGSARRLEADGREEAMRAALLSAARSPLSPPAERALIARMRSDPALTRGAAPEPALVVGVVEANPMAAVELLYLVLPYAPDARRLLDGLASAPLSLHALEVVNRLAAREGSPLADAFVRAFASRCMRECEPPRQGEARGGQLVPDSGSAMAGSAPQPRLVRMVCVLLQGLVTSGPHRFDRAHLAEMQAFSAAFSRVREAASLYRQLCGVRL